MTKYFTVLPFALVTLTLTFGTSLTTAQVNLNGDASVTLDGDTSGTLDVDSDAVDTNSVGLLNDTTVTVGGESDSDALVNVDTTDSQNRVEVLPNSIGGDEIIIRLFGNSAGGTTGTVDATLGSSESDATVNLFGSGNGSGGDQGSAGAGAAPFGPAAGGSTSSGGSGSAGSAAVSGSSANCFAPDASQITHLLNRNSQSVAASISQVSAANVVIIEMCQDSRAQVSQAIGSNANSSAIRNAVAANASIVLALNNAGRTPNHVLAVDTDGSQATVYVL